ncbi:MAG: cupin domain-containing protein [Acidobacteriia bacterium]|nr:cupin domain-containing protein [Methyloceanibacter sp.]MCL6492125.1 cupin domain-containing protein [Terriglobia bacterium]
MTMPITPNAKNHAGLGPLASRFVRVNELPWERTRFAGVETKTLFLDKAHGQVTLLLKMAPGAVLPDHEHVLSEQTYMLEGRLVDKEGPDAGGEAGPGDFVWRPAGSRHAAWAPEGALMIAIFQIPNKFFEPDGRVLDVLGQDWDTHWKPALNAQ